MMKKTTDMTLVEVMIPDEPPTAEEIVDEVRRHLTTVRTLLTVGVQRAYRQNDWDTYFTITRMEEAIDALLEDMPRAE